MKTILIRTSLTGILLFIVFSGAATQCSETRRDGSLRNSVIWKISREDLPAPSYLFGTVHRIDPGDISIHPTVLEQLKRSEVVVFETDLTEPDYLQKALTFAMMDQDSLDGILTPEQYGILKSFFRDEFDFPLVAVKRRKPFYIASLIGTLKTNDNSNSHEGEFIRIASNEGKEIGGISTLEKESEILSGMALEDQVAYLFDEIESYMNGRSELLEEGIWKAYQKGDISTIHALMSGALENHPSIYEQLFVVRNESWLPGMIDKMKDRSCFFAVGVGHLPSESGLIRLLVQEGFKVVPVRKDFWFHSVSKE